MIPRFTRREMLGVTGMAGVADLTGIASGAVAQPVPRRPRIACLVTYWGANMTYRSTRGPQFDTGERPPNIPFMRGCDG